MIPIHQWPIRAGNGIRTRTSGLEGARATVDTMPAGASRAGAPDACYAVSISAPTVEDWGIEPQPSPCKGDVLPLSLVPQDYAASSCSSSSSSSRMNGTFSKILTASL